LLGAALRNRAGEQKNKIACHVNTGQAICITATRLVA